MKWTCRGCGSTNVDIAAPVTRAVHQALFDLVACGRVPNRAELVALQVMTGTALAELHHVCMACATESLSSEDFVADLQRRGVLPAGYDTFR